MAATEEGSLPGVSIVLENLKLTLGGSAAVAAHGCHDERLSPLGLDEVHNGTGHQGVVIDAAAAAGDGNFLAGLNLAADLGPVQFPDDGAGNVAFGNAGFVEILADLDHFGNRSVFD